MGVIFSFARMPKIKPSQRVKKRYIVFQIESGQKFWFEDVKRAIINAIVRYTGEFGLELAKIFIIKNVYLMEKQRGVMRVTLKSLNQIRLVLSKIDSIKGEKANIKIIGISGILKKAKYKFLNK